MKLGSDRYHFVGIGGAGMSALARLLHGIDVAPQVAMLELRIRKCLAEPGEHRAEVPLRGKVIAAVHEQGDRAVGTLLQLVEEHTDASLRGIYTRRARRG